MTELALSIALIVGLVEVSKRLGLSKRWLPVVALVLAVALQATLNGGFDGTILVDGLVVGLTAVGLFSGGKNVIALGERK